MSRTLLQSQPGTPNPSSVGGTFLQRKCACGQHTIGGEQCDECNEKTLNLRRVSDSTGSHEIQSAAPEVVNKVLQSWGQALDSGTRAFFEPRLGAALHQTRPTFTSVSAPQKFAISEPTDVHEQQADQIAERVVRIPDDKESLASNQPHYDLSRIRIHADPAAAQAARAVNALAFTVGEHVVFGNGLYSPNSLSGRRLLAHELAHTAQQTPMLSRAVCATSDICSTIKPPTKLLEEAESSETKIRDEERKKNCGKVPEDPACRADGHAKRAVELEKLVNSYDVTPLTTAQGIFVNKDLKFKALTVSCDTFVPPLASSGHCITVTEEMEKEAALFNSTTGPKEIGGRERGLWRNETLEILIHEAGHTRFRSQFSKEFSDKFSTTLPHLLGKSRPTCKKDDDSRIQVFSSLNELTAMVQEFPVRKLYLAVTVRLDEAGKKAYLEKWRDHRIRRMDQSITNSLRVVRCLCDCKDANDLIRQTVEFATSRWTQSEKDDLNAEMNDPQWKSLQLDWPFPAPAATPAPPPTAP
jgi:hypothetical protein